MKIRKSFLIGASLLGLVGTPAFTGYNHAFAAVSPPLSDVTYGQCSDRSNDTESSNLPWLIFQQLQQNEDTMSQETQDQINSIQERNNQIQALNDALHELNLVLNGMTKDSKVQLSKELTDLLASFNISATGMKSESEITEIMMQIKNKLDSLSSSTTLEMQQLPKTIKDSSSSSQMIEELMKKMMENQTSVLPGGSAELPQQYCMPSDYGTMPPENNPIIGGVQEAELGEYSIGAIGRLGSGWQGSGYLNFNSGEGFVKWKFTVPADGLYDISFIYANGGGSDRPMNASVDNIPFNANLSFLPTGSWNSAWNTVSQTIQLTKGEHVVRLQTKGYSGPNLDQFKVEEHTS